ncbi:YihY/virulence factor BrkB family protein [Formosa sp. S-31]|uniref:YihY/virulence factor BrkB family protein n=1 Tax=Formosa sp. S-31 TaxID=2790949 RepID=UPI003EB6F8E3
MTNSESRRFKIKDLPKLLKDTLRRWLDSDPWRLSAIIAYYTVLSLPALLVIIINVIGSVWGQDIIEGELTQEFSSALGVDAAQSIETMIKETQNPNKNLTSTIIGIATLLFGSTGVFYHLQLSLNEIWGIEAVSTSKINIWGMLKKRARGFAFILVIGFLLLISLIVSTGISLLNNYIRKLFPDIILYLAYFLDLCISLAIIATLFALMFKYLPDVKIKWRSVWVGGFLTAVLFVLGQSLMGYYFGKSNPGSTYGAAGTVVLILLWVSYSCLILFFGAQFTWVFAHYTGGGVQPNDHAVKTE